MPKKGYQTVTITDELSQFLESLPGKTKSGKVEALIRSVVAQESLNVFSVLNGLKTREQAFALIRGIVDWLERNP